MWVKVFEEMESLIKIYSHPRSGTHFIENFVGINFYSKLNLHVRPVEWGHWSNRKLNEEGYPYQKLFAHHFFPPKQLDAIEKGIYMVRDPRAVAYSVWNTENLLNKEDSKLSFSNFLRRKLDWIGSPAMRFEPKFNIVQHWNIHVAHWLLYSKFNRRVLVIKYEDLKLNPDMVFHRINKKFFRSKSSTKEKNSSFEKIKYVTKPTGLLPNAATIDAWKNVFTEEDENFLINHITDSNLLQFLHK